MKNILNSGVIHGKLSTMELAKGNTGGLMINKRLMKLIPEASQYVMKQVGMQWLCLVTNIGFILLISAFVSESRIENIQENSII